jgi:uncharacterized membrane protein
MKRWILAIACLGLASFACAEGEFLDTFLAHYKIKDDSTLGQKSCVICHKSDDDFGFNPYGKDVKKALADKSATVVTAALLTSMEEADADGDGTPNGKEIAAGTFPGDAASGGAPGVTPATTAEEKEVKPSHFPPKNAYHPAIVHFPIALFIGGLILDFWGMVKKDKTLLHAGWYCIIMAAIASAGAVISGAGAMALLKLPYRGLIFNHLAYAIGSTAFMWVMVALRVDRHEQMNIRLRIIYYLFAVATLLMISWAGHLGGLFVYGE